MPGGQRQWRLCLRRVAYHVGVAMGGNVDTRYDMQPVTDHYLKAKVGEDDPLGKALCEAFERVRD